MHFRVSSPPYKWPCSYGMDTGSRSELLAADMSVGEIRDFLERRLARLPRARPAHDRHRRVGRLVLHRVPLGHLPGAGPARRLEAGAGIRRRRTAPLRVGRRRSGDAGARWSRRDRRYRRDRSRRHRRSPTRAPASTSRRASTRSSGSRSTCAPRSGPRSSATSVASAGSSRSPRAICRDPLLVSSTDGVGTKSMIARLTGRYDTIGIDLVAMSVDDIAVQGAEPLFFLDYISIGKLVPEIVDDIVAGVARGCREAGCALLGGEMSEHPDLMAPGEFDLVGFAVGIVERSGVLPSGVRAGDAVIGMASPGLRCNGYSLARRALLDRAGRRLDEPAWKGARHTLGDELLRPSVIYAPAMRQLRERVDVHAFAHVTGGGIPDNLARVLPGNCDAVVRRGRGRSRGSSRRSRPRATSPTTRWSMCSTSGSECWLLCHSRSDSLPSMCYALPVTNPRSWARSSTDTDGSTSRRDR